MWSWTVYGALILGFLAVAGAAAFVAVRVLAAWRALKRLRRGIARELLNLADLGDATADKLGVTTDTEKLDTSLSRLRADVARLRLLRAAIDEASDAFWRVAWIVPRR